MPFSEAVVVPRDHYVQKTYNRFLPVSRVFRGTPATMEGSGAADSGCLDGLSTMTISGHGLLSVLPRDMLGSGGILLVSNPCSDEKYRLLLGHINMIDTRGREQTSNICRLGKTINL